MQFFLGSPRRARDRCDEILAAMPSSADPEHEAARGVARGQLIEVLGRCRLVPGATPAGVARLLLALQREGDRTAWQRSLQRAIPDRSAFLGLYLSARARREIARVAEMERIAHAAGAAGDLDTVSALYAEAGRMITEDRVAPRVGFRLAYVLQEAAQLTPFPVELLRELRRLRLIAPETELTYAAIKETIERRLELRVTQLASSLRRVLRDDLDARPFLDEIEGLAGRHEVVERLGAALDELAARSGEPAIAERARALRARLSSPSP